MKVVVGILTAAIVFTGSFGLYPVYAQETRTETEMISDTETENITESETATEAASETETATEAVTETETEAKVTGHKIENFPMIFQMPELPTGCEITAMTMALRYAGYDVSKVDMAMTYLPRTGFNFSYDGSGRKYGPDMDRYFVGNPSGEGMICGNLAVETAVKEYFKTVKSRHIVKAIKGITTEEMFQYINRDIPVVIWCTIGMGDRQATQGWYTEDGRYMEWSHNDHGAVLIGYDEAKVYIADPICDMISCSREHFENIFTARGRQCVVLLEKNEETIKEELRPQIEDAIAILLGLKEPEKLEAIQVQPETEVTEVKKDEASREMKPQMKKPSLPVR